MIFISSSEPFIPLPKLELPVAIIWYNQGSCGYICKEKVENLMNVARDVSKQLQLNRPPKLEFLWSDVEVLPVANFS